MHILAKTLSFSNLHMTCLCAFYFIGSQLNLSHVVISDNSSCLDFKGQQNNFCNFNMTFSLSLLSFWKQRETNQCMQVSVRPVFSSTKSSVKLIFNKSKVPIRQYTEIYIAFHLLLSAFLQRAAMLALQALY